jgi:hypothetical protein
MKKKIILFVLILAGCFPAIDLSDYSFFDDNLGINYPTQLRTDGVYIRVTEGPNYQGITVKGYNFFRFYKNGRCFYSNGMLGNPVDNELKSTEPENGKWALFKNDDNEIVIEIWGSHYNGFEYYNGKVDSTSLFIWPKEGGFGRKYEFMQMNLNDSTDR